MNIIHFSTCENRGGAAKAAYRLHIGFDSTSINSKMAVAYKNSDRSDILKLVPKSLNFSQRLHRYSIRHLQSIRSILGLKIGFSPTKCNIEFYQNSKPLGYELFSDISTPFNHKIIQQLPDSDVIHLHWISQFIDYDFFFEEVLEQSKPIVWTLHDMNPFTGGCHYDNFCAKFESGCGACPQLGSNLSNDLSSYIWQKKMHIFSNIPSNQMYVVSPSQWLAKCAKKSPILNKFPISVIPYGINTDDFSPRERNFSRDVLGIPKDSKVLLFIADSVANHRKGYRHFEELMRKFVGDENICAAILGKNLSAKKVFPDQYYLGHIEHERLLSLAYSAADIFVIPSLQDNLPNTVLESLSCGTPVAGFNVGGLPEMINGPDLGLLVESGKVDALAEAVLELLQADTSSEEISLKCRNNVQKNYSLKLTTKRYTELYKSILKDFKN